MEKIKKEFIEKWEKIFKQNQFEMGMAFILYNMSCNEKYEELTIEEKQKLLEFAYKFYLQDENCIDIGKITDTVLENKDKIINGEIDKYNLYNYLDY